MEPDLLLIHLTGPGILISDASNNTIGPGNVISGVARGIFITEYFGIESVVTSNNKIIGNLSVQMLMEVRQLVIWRKVSGSRTEQRTILLDRIM